MALLTNNNNRCRFTAGGACHRRPPLPISSSSSSSLIDAMYVIQLTKVIYVWFLLLMPCVHTCIRIPHLLRCRSHLYVSFGYPLILGQNIEIHWTLCFHLSCSPWLLQSATKMYIFTTRVSVSSSLANKNICFFSRVIDLSIVLLYTFFFQYVQMCRVGSYAGNQNRVIKTYEKK